jgi:hypothetical protein
LIKVLEGMAVSGDVRRSTVVPLGSVTLGSSKLPRSKGMKLEPRFALLALATFQFGAPGVDVGLFSGGSLEGAFPA